jgi:hypothetical protein
VLIFILVFVCGGEGNIIVPERDDLRDGKGVDVDWDFK